MIKKELSEEFMIWDEFIPMIGERVDREEGEQILTLYKTISRARLHLGRKPLKLILLANYKKLSDIIIEASEGDVKNDTCQSENE